MICVHLDTKDKQIVAQICFSFYLSHEKSCYKPNDKITKLALGLVKWNTAN